MEESDDEPIIESATHDEEGNVHGWCTALFEKSNVKFEGNFEHGKKHGKGTFHFNYRFSPKEKEIIQKHSKITNNNKKRKLEESSDSSDSEEEETLSGTYVNDVLEGLATHTFSDGKVLKSHYVNGDMEGFSQEYDENGVVAEGYYSNNCRVGLWRFLLEGGGVIEGEHSDPTENSSDEEVHQEDEEDVCVDTFAKLAIKDGKAYFFYPDHNYALIGEWKDGRMIKSQFFKCKHIDSSEQDKFSLPSSKNFEFEQVVNNNENTHYYSYDPSTSNHISSEPLLYDPWESLVAVYVKRSSIEDPEANEGLFAKKDFHSGEIVSFYNGTRVLQKEVDDRDWKDCNNTITLDVTSGTVIDVPSPFHLLTNYCASLGHKANHSFTPNAKYDSCEHPRFGRIKCIRAITPIKKDEEILVNYEYSHGESGDDVPQWYKRLLDKKP